MQGLEVFFGEANPAAARVYARLPVAKPETGLRLTGQVIGPQSRFSKTLPTRAPLVDLGPGPALLAAAIVPDPCFWTPDLPMLYRAEVELRRGDELVSTEERWLGVRRLDVRGQSLYLDGKRWVLRGVDLRGKQAIEPDWVAARECGASLLVSNPDDATCLEASWQGVTLLVEADHSQIERFKQWPSVLSAHHIALIEAADVAQFASRTREQSLPIIALRPHTADSDIAARRAACDILQRDLAPIGDFAGYVC